MFFINQFNSQVRHFVEQLACAPGVEAMAAAKIKSTALSVTHKCRVLLTSNINARSSLITCCCSCSDLPRPFLSQNILAAGWEAHLNTIKADAKGRFVDPVATLSIHRSCRIVAI
jgi:hypothetical protein